MNGGGENANISCSLEENLQIYRHFSKLFYIYIDIYDEDEHFVKLLHKKMFGNVWKWAGKFRQSNKNIGIDWYQIPVELKKLCDDVEYWINNKTFSEDEIAACFHHRLISIHLFPNGNGRHARLIADILLENFFDSRPFTWGNANLVTSGDDRDRYMKSLYAADKGDYKCLLEFARS